MVEYLRTLLFMSSPWSFDILEWMKGAVNSPFIWLVLIGLGILLMRTRVR
jgi:hypothetical protein